VANFATIFASVVDTGGNLPPASLSLGVKLIHEKKPEAKNLVTLSL
jgi:hypothetical protein